MQNTLSEVVDPYEQQARDMFDIQGLEQQARDGIESYKGVRHLEFRVGVEMEFSVLQSPQQLKELFESNVGLSDPDATSAFKRDVLNPHSLDLNDTDNYELLEELKNHAKGFLRNIDPVNDEENFTKAKWLKQIEDFKPRDILHFLLYEEFSKPSLAIPKLAEDATLSGLDDYSEASGWIEWRFGTGKLQQGYYDNEGVSEIRLSPCTPTEAVKRTQIIRKRIAELGDSLGFVVKYGVTSVAGLLSEHINLSVFDARKPDEASLIGNSDSKVDDTVDITSGIVEGFQDGLRLNANTIKNYDYMFSEYHSESMEVAPTRKALRVLANRVELRSRFNSTEHGIAWLMAGTIDGLTYGAQALEKQGYGVTSFTSISKVERTPDFDKDSDIQIQRAFENSSIDDQGRFELIWSYIRGEELEEQLYGGTDVERLDFSFLFSAVLVDRVGKPFISSEELVKAHDRLSDPMKQRIILPEESELEKIVAVVNERLAVVRILPDKAIQGEANSKGAEIDLTLDRLRKSRVAQLALGSSLGAYIDNINHAADAFQEKKEVSEK